MTDEKNLPAEVETAVVPEDVSMLAGTAALEDANSSDPTLHFREHVAATDFAVQIPDLSAGGENETLTGTNTETKARTFPSGSLLQIPITVRVILGSAKLTLGEMASLGPGSVLTLDQTLSDPVALMANGNKIAKGLLVVLDDESGEIGISLTEIIGELSNEKLSA